MPKMTEMYLDFGGLTSEIETNKISNVKEINLQTFLYILVLVYKTVWAWFQLNTSQLRCSTEYESTRVFN